MNKQELLKEIERLESKVFELQWRNEDLKLMLDVYRNTLEGRLAIEWTKHKHREIALRDMD